MWCMCFGGGVEHNEVGIMWNNWIVGMGEIWRRRLDDIDAVDSWQGTKGNDNVPPILHIGICVLSRTLVSGLWIAKMQNG